MVRIIPRPRYKLYLNVKILTIILKKILTGKVYRGKCVKEFEEKFKEYIGVNYAIAAPMARTSLFLILSSLGLKEGDEVIVTSYTIADVINMIICAGLKPVFVDIDDTYNMNPKKIESKITNKTKVILLTDIFGQPCDREPILEIAKRHNLTTIADCAQSYGAEYHSRKTGSSCDYSFFSFSSYKNGTTFFGGMIATNDRKMAEKLRERAESYPYPPFSMLAKRILRDVFLWAMTSKYVFPLTYLLVASVNLFDDTLIDRALSTKLVLRTSMPEQYKIRFTNLQAAIALEQLKNIDRNNNKRIRNAEYYNKQLKEIEDLGRIEPPKKIDNVKHIYLNYPVKAKNRKDLLKKLFKSGLDTTAGNLPNCSELDIFKEYKSDCPQCSRAVKEVFYLPIQPQLKEKDLEYIVGCIKRAVG